jgi:hypothetical protein
MYANPSRQKGSHLPAYAVRRKMRAKHRLRFSPKRASADRGCRQIAIGINPHYSAMIF